MKKLQLPIGSAKRVLTLLTCWFLLNHLVTAQNINRVEYFYDTDPGFGNGTSVSFTAAADIPSLGFTANITALQYGFHTLYVRSRDANGKWSLTNNQPFIRYTASNGPVNAGNIVKMEYFIDTDPGFGAGTNVPVTASTDIPNMNFTVSITGVGYGFHTLYVRTKDANGKWSLTQNYPFIRYIGQSANSSAGNIVKMEYFIDADPGFGAGVNVPVTASTDIPGMVFNVSLASISNGFHTLYVRTKDANGKWSLTNNSPFIKYAPINGPANAGNVVKIEYFIDADPGFGQGINVPVTASTDIAGTVFNVSIASIANGFHTLYIRSKDSDGKWSLTNNSPFIKYAATTGPVASGNVTRIEYFIDNDPGFGYGINMPFTHSPDVRGFVATLNLSTLPNGFHTLYIRSKDTLGKWSLTNYASFSGGSAIVPPVAVINSNGPDTFCLGAGTYLYAGYTYSSTYQWQLNNANINGATNIDYTPTQTGNYRVIVTNSIGSDTSSSIHVIVNSTPTANISANGALSFCQGGSVTLSVNQTSGASYQWYQNGGSINGANSSSYVAQQSGAYYAVVTVPGGCFATSAKDTVSVTAAPSASITTSGSTTFCTGDSVSLSVPTGSGFTYHWNTNANTSSIKVYASGTFSVTVTSGTNCSATSTQVTVTVLQVPTANITPGGPTTFCNGSSVLLSANTGTGLSYSWTGGSNASSITVTSTGTYYVTVSNAACSKVSSPVTVTVNPGPSVSISATANTICRNGIDTLTATGATTYAWSPAGGLNTTTGSPVYASPTSTTTYTVTGTTSGCIGTASVTVNINSNNTGVSTTTPTICNGGSAVLNATGASSYLWSPTGTLSAGSGGSVTATPTSTTTYTVTGTTGSCSSTATVTVNVSQTVVPTVTISTPQTSICSGIAITFTASGTNGGSSPTYQWYKNGTLQSGNSASYGPVLLANNDSVWCVMTSNAPCPSPASVTSNKLHITVTPSVTPTISIAASANAICAGDSIVFTASITNGGTPVFQWMKNGSPVGSNASSYTVYTPLNNDSVWCVLTSNAICATQTNVTSNKIRIAVNPITVPTISVTPAQSPICVGSTVTFLANTTSAGSSPSYQWYLNNNTVGLDQDNYTAGPFNDGDSVWCVLTSNASCISQQVVVSAKYVIQQTPISTPSVYITAADTTVCANNNALFTAYPTNGGNPTYQWFKNGVQQAGNQSTFALNAPANNDSVWCVMISNAACVSPTTATSDKIIIEVTSVVVPTISIGVSQNPVCAGDSIQFNALITNGGATPGYQWYRNNIAVGPNADVYSDNIFANGDSIWCVLTSSAQCPSVPSIASNKIAEIVNPIVVPSVSITSTQTTVCSGNTVVFSAIPVNGGSSPTYQWYKNGQPLGNNAVDYTDANLADNDSLWCVLTSNSNCSSPDTAVSNIINITYDTIVVPSVHITADPTSICYGSSVIFKAVPRNGGIGPVFNWYINNQLQAATGRVFTTTALAAGDSVYCVLNSTVTCATPPSVRSNASYINVTMPSTYIFSADICQGDSFVFAGIARYQSGSYQNTLPASTGCDSIVTLQLNVRTPAVTQQFVPLCYGGSYVFHGQVLTASGTYADTTASTITGCDSITVLTLQIQQQLSSGYNASVCQGYNYNFNGRLLNTAGVYADTVTGSSGCDSIITLTLSLRSNSSSGFSASVCQGQTYMFNGRPLTQAGVYNDTLVSVNGCDSVVTLNFSVHPLPTPVVTRTGRDTLSTTAYTHYRWLYNNVIQATDTGRVLVATQDGQYSVWVTDSYGCTDTSGVITIVGLSIDEALLTSFSIYPNPTQNLVHIKAETTLQEGTIELLDNTGRLILTNKWTGPQIQQDMELGALSSGMYLLVIRSNNNIMSTHRIVKN